MMHDISLQDDKTEENRLDDLILFPGSRYIIFFGHGQVIF
jgi:hypothetical protein